MPDAVAPDPFTAMAAQLTPKRAVSYIRVSTREQAQRGGSEEGFSLPAQREANKRKAQSMGALVVKEFADRGESARSANRPELQKMLAYLKEDGGIDYVIVHKLDRLARNRADDVEINRAFEEAGVRLVSTSENIDQTPGGMLLHGIMSSIAEFYSRNLANEVIKGMGEKARNGGTLGKAPLGYLNVRARDENGREIRTIALDEERAPLVRLAFTEYATGNWTVRQLADHLNTLGLSIPPTPRRCAKPITTRRLHKILRHPYYKGTISFQGVEYAGTHEPLVDEETWSQVQAMLDSHRYGERQRIHNHFLKSTVVCGQCGARLSVQNAKNSKGTIYPYFVCARRCRLHDCAFKAVLIDVVEDRMSDLYQTIQLSAADRTQIEHYLHDELAQIEGDKAKAVRSLTTRRTNIEDRRRRLLHAHYEGAIPLDLLKEEQAKLTSELSQIERQLTAYKADAAEVRQHLTQALDLLEDCHRLYQAAPPHLKKLLNQVFFQRVLVNPLVDEEGRVIVPSTGDGTTDGGKQPGKDTGAHDGQQSDRGEEGTGDDSRGEGADADTPTLTPHSVHLADTGFGTRLSALLVPPFDQLASPSLHTAAHVHHLQHAAQPDKPTTPPTADDGPMSSTTRTTPTLVGERCSTSGTASQPVSTGEGLDKSWLVRKKGLEPSRPKAPEPKSGASANSATRAVRLTLPLLEPAMFPKSSAGEGALSVDAELLAQTGDMAGGSDVVTSQPYSAISAIGAHHDGGADDSRVGAPVVLLLTPGAPLLHDPVLGVGQQREGQRLLACEIGQRARGIRGDPDDGVPGGRPCCQGIAEITGLLGATRCGGPGVEVDDDAVLGAASQRRERDVGAGRVGQGEIRGRVSDGELRHGVLLIERVPRRFRIGCRGNGTTRRHSECRVVPPIAVIRDRILIVTRLRPPAPALPVRLGLAQELARSARGTRRRSVSSARHERL